MNTSDKPRFGICNINGESFGFVFVEYFWTLRQLRDAIDDHFKEIGLRQRIDYTFIEKNGWPVSTNQELILSVLDIVSNQTIRIQSGSIRISSIAPTPVVSNIKAIEDVPQMNGIPAIKYRPNDEILLSNPQKTDISQTDSVPTTQWNKKSKKNFSVRYSSISYIFSIFSKLELISSKFNHLINKLYIFMEILD